MLLTTVYRTSLIGSFAACLQELFSFKGWFHSSSELNKEPTMADQHTAHCPSHSAFLPQYWLLLLTVCQLQSWWGTSGSQLQSLEQQKSNTATQQWVKSFYSRASLLSELEQVRKGAWGGRNTWMRKSGSNGLRSKAFLPSEFLFTHCWLLSLVCSFTNSKYIDLKDQRAGKICSCFHFQWLFLGKCSVYAEKSHPRHIPQVLGSSSMELEDQILGLSPQTAGTANGTRILSSEAK